MDDVRGIGIIIAVTILLPNLKLVETLTRKK